MSKGLDSPRLTARIAGLLYLVIMVAAAFAEMYARSSVIVTGDAAATAANILASEQTFRLGGAAQLVTILCDVTLAVLFFELMKPVGRTVALLAGAFRLAAIIVMAVTTVMHFAPLTMLDASYLNGFSDEQRQALAQLSLRLHSIGYNITLLLFGVHCVLLGYLIARSSFLPTLIGLLMALAGSGYVVNSFVFFVYPSLTSWTFPVMVPLAMVAEGALALWLTIVGVNAEKWRTQSVGTA